MDRQNADKVEATPFNAPSLAKDGYFLFYICFYLLFYDIIIY